MVHKLNNAPIDVYSVLKRIRHDNIAEVYDAFEIDGKTVVIEEYINVIALSELTDTMSPLGVKRVMIQLCSGLSALYSLGIVHRDITLNNIMLTDSGIIKIIDFDISKLYKIKQKILLTGTLLVLSDMRLLNSLDLTKPMSVPIYSLSGLSQICSLQENIPLCKCTQRDI